MLSELWSRSRPLPPVNRSSRSLVVSCESEADDDEINVDEISIQTRRGVRREVEMMS
jgi:hypothetical protein